MMPAIKGIGTAGSTRMAPQAKAMDRAGVDAAPISATWEVVKGLSSRSVRVPAGRGVWRSLSARSGR